MENENLDEVLGDLKNMVNGPNVKLVGEVLTAGVMIGRAFTHGDGAAFDAGIQLLNQAAEDLKLTPLTGPTGPVESLKKLFK